MKEQKVAPIIAHMNPQKAKIVSLEFSKIADGIDSIKKK
jgi:flagellar motility protein MotE (MotC chaperone)